MFRIRFSLFIWFLLVSGAVAQGPVGVISTVAGAGGRVFGGDNGPAARAFLNRPHGVAILTEPDGSLSLVVVDTGNQRIRKVTLADGIIRTVAGNGTAGYFGEGGVGVGASLSDPTTATPGLAGSLLFADMNNNRIRRLEPNGRVVTMAGNGESGYSGEGGATSVRFWLPFGVAVASDGTVYVADQINHRIRRVSAGGVTSTIAGTGVGGFGGDGGPATGAQLAFPTGVVIASDGSLLIADYLNHRIRRIGTDGRISTVAGNGSAGAGGDGGAATAAQLNQPRGIALSKDGFYIVDSGNHRIRKVDSAGRIYTIAGTGIAGFAGDGSLASTARLNSPQSAVEAPDGSLYIADTENDRIRRVVFQAGGGPVTPPAQSLISSAPTSLAFAYTVGAATPSSFPLTLTASGASLPFQASGATESGGNWLRVSPPVGSTPATLAVSIEPVGLNPGTYRGSVIVAATGANTVRIEVVLTVSPSPTPILPPSILGGRISATINTIAGDGIRRDVGDNGPATAASLNQPAGVSVFTDLDGSPGLYIADTLNHRVRKLNLASGRISGVAGIGSAGNAGDGVPATSASLNYPVTAIANGAGAVLIADLNNNRIRRIDSTGRLTTFAGSGEAGYIGEGGATSVRFWLPYGVAAAADGSVFVADQANHRIRRIAPGGQTSVAAGTGVGGFRGDGGLGISAQLAFPAGLALAADGSLLIADLNNHRIRRLGLDGRITTVAGTGVAGYGGDGGPATSAQLFEPRHIAIAQDGFYIADSKNNRIRKVALDGTISTVAGNGVAGFSGDNGPAGAARLNSPTALAVGPDGALYIADTDNDRIRRVVFTSEPDSPAVPNDLQLTATQLTFATNVATPAPRTAFVGAVTPVSPINLTVTASTNSGGNWLTVVPGRGSTPLVIEARMNPSALVAGTYGGTITVNGGAPLQTRTITVTLVVAPAPNPSTSRNGTILTVAGSGVRGFSGDGGPATAAQLNQPFGVHVAVDVDSRTYFYVADTFNQRVRRVSLTDGRISTVVGSGLTGDSGSGGPSTSIALNLPTGVAVTPQGTIQISDLNNHRIVSAATDGITYRYAGTGTRGYSGDGGPSGEAQLAVPMNQALGPDGSTLIADRDNHRIRRIDVNGRMFTFAGSGRAGFGGDGGSALNADLSFPSGVAIESDGSVLIADMGNHRIRRVGLDGVIRTVVGTGQTGSAGDGGLAINAQLNEPRQIATGTDGFFIADSKNHRIRKVIYASGVIETIAGNGTAGSSGDGGPAASAGLNTPQSVAVAPDGSLYIADTENNRIRRVIFSSEVPVLIAPSLQVSSTRLEVSAVSGGSPPSAQLVNLTSTAASLAFTVAAETLNGGNWLRVNSPQGRTPASVSISVDPGPLGPGVYTGTITLNAPDAANPRQSIIVVLNLSQPLDTLSVSPGNLSFTWQQGTTLPPLQVLSLSSKQAGAEVKLELVGGGEWISVEPTTGRTPLEPFVRVRPEGLTPGQYTASLNISGPNLTESLRVPVALRVTAAAILPTLRLDPVSLTFKWPSEGPAPEPQIVAAIVSGAETITYTVNSSIATGTNWLILGSRSVTASAASPGRLQLRVNPAGLTPGTYEGEVTFVSAGAVRARLPVQLQITPRVNAELRIDATMLQLSAPVGLVAEPGQLTVKNPSPSILNFSVKAETSDGGDWLKVNPAIGRLAGVSNELPAMVTVAGDATNLAPGTYSGTIQLSSESGGGLSAQVLRVPVVFAVSDRPVDVAVSDNSIKFEVGRGGKQARDLSVVALGRGTTGWTASVTAGSNWLSLEKASGVLSQAAPVATFDVSADSRSLTPGDYSGKIEVRWQGSARPIEVSVQLRVTSREPAPSAVPASLAFVPDPGGSNPAPRGVLIFPGNAGSISLGEDPNNETPGTDWILVERTNGGLRVGVEMSRIRPGTPYRGSIFVTTAGNETLVIKVIALKPIAQTGAQDPFGAKAADGCRPQSFYPLFTTAQPRFSVQAGDAVSTQVVVVDDCGQLAARATAGSNFSSRERPITLAPLSSGVWSATWVPRLENAGEVEVETLTTDFGLTVRADPVRVRAFVGSAAEGQPFLDASNPILGADGREPLAVAPGSLIELRGKNFLAGGATSVSLGGSALEIQSATAERIVAVVPRGFEGRGRQSLIVGSGERLSAAESVIVAELWPVVSATASEPGGRLALFVSGIDAAIGRPAVLNSLRFGVGRQTCRTGSPEPAGPGLWKVSVTGCPGATPTNISARIGGVLTQGFSLPAETLR